MATRPNELHEFKNKKAIVVPGKENKKYPITFDANVAFLNPRPNVDANPNKTPITEEATAEQSAWATVNPVEIIRSLRNSGFKLQKAP